MLAYSTIGVKNMEKATAFYDSLLAELGGKQALVARDGDFVAYSNNTGAFFAIAVPFDGKEAQPGNGNMVAIACESLEQIKQLHAKAISLGATDEWTPGPRVDGAVQCGYVRDLDGNKLNFFHM